MISVVIPAYQAERFITESIKSAQNQTLAPTEIIVVDDGSTDRTVSLAEAQGAKVISKPNGGVASARNAGIREARNEWVALLDADDVWEPDKLERQLEAASRFPTAGFITTNNSFFDDDGVWVETYLDRLGSDYFKAGRNELEPGMAFFKQIDFQGINWLIPSPSALLVKKEVFETVGYFDEQLSAVDDTEFYLRAMGRFEFVFLEEPLVRYRQTSGGQAGNHLLCGESFLKAIEKIAANPEAYPAGVFESAMKVKPDRMSLYGKALVRAGRYAEARTVLSQSWKAEPKPRTLVWWMASLAHIKI